MNDKLIKLLGLKADATEEQILAAIKSIQEESTALEKLLVEALGLKTNADHDKILQAVTELQEGAADAGAEVERLKGLLAQKGGSKLSGEDEEIIRQKIAAGLSRETALEALANQKAEDATKKTAKASK